MGGRSVMCAALRFPGDWRGRSLGTCVSHALGGLLPLSCPLEQVEMARVAPAAVLVPAAIRCHWHLLFPERPGPSCLSASPVLSSQAHASHHRNHISEHVCFSTLLQFLLAAGVNSCCPANIYSSPFPTSSAAKRRDV